MALDINGHNASAIVRGHIQKLVVDQTSHSDSLLFSAWMVICLVDAGALSVLFTSDDISKSHVVRTFAHIIPSDTLLLYLTLVVRVDDLTQKDKLRSKVDKDER